MNRNPRLSALPPQYLFPEIRKHANHYRKHHPDAQLISLGIGDTTQPLPLCIAEAMAKRAEAMATQAGYTGYGPEEGELPLRLVIANAYAQQGLPSVITPEEVIVSDGTKSDIGRLFQLFGPEVSVAVQDPAYPAYIEAATVAGIDKIMLMPCTPENDFFPSLEALKHVDVIVWCSPNNPTGTASTYEQLKTLVDFAKANGSIILYDAAYAAYIDDPALPRSIYAIPGAEEVAIEMGSFSKSAGFTGIRLGWTVIPHTLTLSDGTSLHADFLRMIRTLFNGACTLSQAGGIAALSEEGRNALSTVIAQYKQHARALVSIFKEQGFAVYGGLHCPYVWLHVPQRSSWELFTALLEKRQLITTPGVGFGRAGESFLRLTAFTAKHLMPQALSRLQNLQDLLQMQAKTILK